MPELNGDLGGVLGMDTMAGSSPSFRVSHQRQEAARLNGIRSSDGRVSSDSG